MPEPIPKLLLTKRTVLNKEKAIEVSVKESANYKRVAKVKVNSII